MTNIVIQNVEWRSGSPDDPTEAIAIRVKVRNHGGRYDGATHVGFELIGADGEKIEHLPTLGSIGTGSISGVTALGELSPGEGATASLPRDHRTSLQPQPGWDRLRIWVGYYDRDTGENHVTDERTINFTWTQSGASTGEVERGTITETAVASSGFDVDDLAGVEESDVVENPMDVGPSDGVSPASITDEGHGDPGPIGLEAGALAVLIAGAWILTR